MTTDEMDVTESEKMMAMVRAGAEPLLSLDEVKAKYPTSSPKAAKRAEAYAKQLRSEI